MLKLPMFKFKSKSEKESLTSLDSVNDSNMKDYKVPCEEMNSVFSATEKLSFFLQGSIKSVSKVMFHMIKQHESLKSFSKNIDNILESISDTSNEVSQVDTSLSNLDQSIQDTSSTIEKMANSVQNVATIVSDRIGITEDLANASTEGANKVNKVLEVINVLSENVDAIKDIIVAINKISEKTNLLAMNAAIEAAHAGQAGLGFAVVAGEIRRLSEGTKKNAYDIESTLKSMLFTLEEAHQSAGAAGTAMEWIGGKVTETKNSFSEISREMDSLASGGMEIMSTARDISEVSSGVKASFDSVVNNMKNVVTEVEDERVAFNDIENRSKDITKLMSSTMVDLDNMLHTALDIDGASRRNMDVLACEKSNIRYEKFPFTTILLKHLAWVTKVRTFLDGDISGEGVNLIDHHACDLGKWIDSQPLDSSLTLLTYWKDLTKAHEDLHNLLRVIFKERDTLSPEDLEDRYRELLEASNTVITLLTKIRNNSSQVRKYM